MAKELSEDTSFNISIKTLLAIGFAIVTLVGMWFTLQADITEAKELPLPPDPEITRMEYDMKDQLIRQTIMSTQEDVKEIKDQMIRVEEKIDIFFMITNIVSAQHIREDRIIHTTSVYLLSASTTALVYNRTKSKKKAAVYGFILPMMVGVAKEIRDIKHGDPDVNDVIANMVGASLGIITIRITL